MNSFFSWIFDFNGTVKHSYSPRYSAQVWFDLSSLLPASLYLCQELSSDYKHQGEEHESSFYPLLPTLREGRVP